MRIRRLELRLRQGGPFRINAVTGINVDVEAMGRELVVLKEYEEMADDE